MFNTVFHSFVVIDYILSSLTWFIFVDSCVQSWPEQDKGLFFGLACQKWTQRLQRKIWTQLLNIFNYIIYQWMVYIWFEIFYNILQKVLMAWKTVIYGWRTSNFRCHSGSRWCKVQMESHHRQFDFRKWKNSKGIWSNLKFKVTLWKLSKIWSF